MERVSFDQELHFKAWCEACSDLTHIDRYCSSPFWGIPLCAAFQDDGDIFVYRAAEDHFAVFCERQVKGGVLILPADGMWLLGTPIMSNQPTAFFKELVRYWAANPHPAGVRQILIGGLYEQSSLLRSNFWKPLGGWELDDSQRMVASLDGGLDGFLSRRSRNFRSRLRRTVKAAEQDQLIVEPMEKSPSEGDCRVILERIFAIESRCWKGQKGQGINTGGMRRFYELMIPLLARHGNLRGLFLTRDGQDCAYLFGAHFNGYFRGLQFSFCSNETLGLGNVCQYHMINSLLEEGCGLYDLGQGMAYKKRWSEHHISSRSFVFQIA